MNPRQIWNDIKKLNLSESETFKRIYKITGSMNAHKFDLNLRKMRQIEARNEALDPEVLRQIKLGWDNGLNSICNDTQKQLIDVFIQDFRNTFPDFDELQKKPKAEFVLVPTYQKVDSDKFEYIGLKPKKIGAPVQLSLFAQPPSPPATQTEPIQPIHKKNKSEIKPKIKTSKINVNQYIKLFLSINKKFKTTQAIENNSMLSVQNQTLLIKTTNHIKDLETCVYIKLNKSEPENSILINTDTVIQNLDEIKNITITKDFSAYFGKAKILGMSDIDYPSIEVDINELIVSLDTNLFEYFKYCSSRVIFDKDTLSNLFIDINSMIFTNGHFLIHKKIDYVGRSFMFPAIYVPYMIPNREVKIYENKVENYFLFQQTAEETTFDFLYKSPNGIYPNWRALLPKFDFCMLKINVDNLLIVLKKCMKYTNENNYAVYLSIDFKRKSIKFHAHETSKGLSYEDYLTFESLTEKEEIFVPIINAGILVDILESTMKKKNVFILIKGDESPMLFMDTNEIPTDYNCDFILMMPLKKDNY